MINFLKEMLFVTIFSLVLATVTTTLGILWIWYKDK